MASTPLTAFNAPDGARIPEGTTSRRVLHALADLLNRQGTASIREIGAAAGLSSTSGVSYHLHKLAMGGYVEEPVHNRPRGWQLTREGWTAAQSRVSE